MVVTLRRFTQGRVATLGVVGGSAATRVALAVLLLAVVAGCATRNPDATPVPRVTIENRSGKPVDIVSFSPRDGTSVTQATLADGGTFGSEPAGTRCDNDISYFVVAAGRRVATLDRPGCIGGTLVITPQMLLAPDGDATGK